MMHHQVVVIGGGPAGLAAACGAAEAGCRDVLVVERGQGLGGILNQCIHDGFGLDLFGESLTGPEWAQRFADRSKGLGVGFLTDSMVLELRPDLTMLVSGRGELLELQADAVVLAMGCRERTRDAIVIPGTRPAGIYTAGLAQNLINLKGYMIGRTAVVLGSGDVGLIMARRLTLEGARVLACAEVLPYPSGLARNVVQCLEDFGIPLLLSHTVTEIHGKDRVEGVTISRVDDRLEPIPGTGTRYDCDTLLVSVGLIPENELTRGAGIEMDPLTGGAVVDGGLQTSVGGIFACGNVLHVHDLVDSAAVEAMRAGENAWAFCRDGVGDGWWVAVRPAEGVRYVVPQRIRAGGAGAELSLRVARPGRDVRLQVRQGGAVLTDKKVPRAVPSEMLKLRLRGALKGGLPLDVGLVGGDGP